MQPRDLFHFFNIATGVKRGWRLHQLRRQTRRFARRARGLAAYTG